MVGVFSRCFGVLLHSVVVARRSGAALCTLSASYSPTPVTLPSLVPLMIQFQLAGVESSLSWLSTGSWYTTALLSLTQYTEARDLTFLDGLIHSNAVVLPSDLRDAMVSRCSNYVEVRDVRALSSSSAAGGNGGRDRYRYENTFIVSSWYPTLQSLRQRKPNGFVSYHLHPDKAIKVRVLEGAWVR